LIDGDFDSLALSDVYTFVCCRLALTW